MAFPRWLKLANFLALLGCLILVPERDAPFAVELISASEFQAEVARFKDLGGEYSPSGFPDLPPQITPFAEWRRAHRDRLQGSEVYVCRENIRVWKSVFCGPQGSVYVELSLMDREGNQIPFAWQDCLIQCQSGGFCDSKKRLYLDLNGDGDAEMVIPRMDSLGKMEKGFFKNTRFLFKKDIFPLWLKRLVGPDFKNLATIGPRDSVPAWRDQPLTVKSQEEVKEGGSH